MSGGALLLCCAVLCCAIGCASGCACACTVFVPVLLLVERSRTGLGIYPAGVTLHVDVTLCWYLTCMCILPRCGGNGDMDSVVWKSVCRHL